MTKEPIMIDGVDVSGCENYGETMAKTRNCILYDKYLRPCKGGNCYYKNWQRKEQQLKDFENEYEGFAVKYTDMEMALKRKMEECEEWKSKYYNSTTEVKADLIKQLDQLKAENEELKTEFDKFEEQIKLQGNFIDSFLLATKNSEWRNKSILEDEADAIIEKVESDYVQLENYKQALQEIKEIAEKGFKLSQCNCGSKADLEYILQKCEVLKDE